VADDIFFVPALKGPRGTQWASEHVMGIYAIWKFAQSPDVAKQFLLDLIARYRDAVLASKLYNFPSYPGSVAEAGVPVAQKPAAGATTSRMRAARAGLAGRAPCALCGIISAASGSSPPRATTSNSPIPPPPSRCVGYRCRRRVT